MSWELRAEVPRWPGYDETRAWFATPDLVCEGEEPGAGPWPGGCLRFHRREVSTRSIEVTREGRRLTVRIPAGASPEDHDLALAIVEAVVRDPHATIDAEALGTVPLPSLREWRAPERLAGLARGPIEGLARLVDLEGTVSLDGPVRPYSLGPRLLARLRASGPEEGLADRILADMLRVQWGPETRGFTDASVFVSAAKPRKRLAFWLPGRSLVLPGGVESYMVDVGKDDGRRFLEVPPEKMAEVAGDHFAGYLDENAGLVTAAEGAEWDALVARARRVAVETTPVAPGAARSRPKRWWQFWRR